MTDLINTFFSVTACTLAVCASPAYALSTFSHQATDSLLSLEETLPLLPVKTTEDNLPRFAITQESHQLTASATVNQNSINTEVQTTDLSDDAFAFDNATETPNHAVSDPLEPYNRVMFGINTTLDKHLAKPVAQAYKSVTPRPVRSGVGNFFQNISEPWNSVNLMLQGKPESSFTSMGRFVINTVTTLGLADPASSSLGLTTTDEDFGQTLGVWGVPSGPYFVLPIFGPSTLRDATGRVIDSTGNPISYIDNSAISAGAGTINGIDKRAQLLTFEGIVNTEDYELVRDVYLQKRDFDISESGTNSTESKPEEFDEGFGD